MKMPREGASTFASSEEGNMTVFSVFMLILILTITGAAVDIMRFEAVRAKMQSTMDRAVLAAADLDQRQDPVFVVNDYMNKAGLAGVVADVTVEESNNARTVTAWGTGVLDTIFLGMSGFDTLTTPALSAADERVSNVEISMVLDISGSMRWNDRLVQMKPAAQAFVEKVMSAESNGITTLNVVPFAGHVNPGDTLFDYFRGERPKIKKENNGWGNGDQDAPGNSLCNNGAENEYEGSIDPTCTDGSTAESDVAVNGYFEPWTSAISEIVVYFDTDYDGIYDVAHKIRSFPADAPRDADEFFRGAVAYLFSQDPDLTDHNQFLGISVKGSGNDARYFQVKGDENGSASDLGPTKHKGKRPGDTFSYSQIDYDYWAADYVVPSPGVTTDAEATTDMPAGQAKKQNINMPSSCVEIYDTEFANTAMPVSEDYVPHFHYWGFDPQMEWGWCPDENNAIQYYSDDKEALKQFIGDMDMFDGTGLQYGLKYGLALLDPSTSDAVDYLIDEGMINPAFRGRPIAWDDPETEKFVVIMTDGQTTEQVRPTDPKAAINGEVELSVQGSGSWSMFSQKTSNVDNLMAQCNLAKSLGVTVFTIAYETDAAATRDMRECASSPSHAFHVTGDEITDAFDIVARQINNLRLIQ